MSALSAHMVQTDSAELKNARTVIVPVASVFLAVIKFLAVNGLGDRAEIPHRSPLTVQFLLSFLAQLVLGNKLGHDHQLLSHGVRGFYHETICTASYC